MRTTIEFILRLVMGHNARHAHVRSVAAYTVTIVEPRKGANMPG